jgi:Domain of unknown function (DUF4282)
MVCMDEPTAKGFLASLFDLDFKEFITTKIIKLLYILGICCAGLSAAIMLLVGLIQGGTGLVALVVAPVAFLLWVIGLRVWLELVIVIFKISENTEIMAGKEAGKTGIG